MSNIYLKDKDILNKLEISANPSRLIPIKSGYITSFALF